MRLVHLADLHLGFRQYHRNTPSGINQREADIAGTIQRAFKQIVELNPDIVVIGGDIFHTVRPSNPAILHAYRSFSYLRDSLPDAAIVMIAGNHDSPRTQETGCILRLFRELGIHVADSSTEQFVFPSKGLSVLAVPDVHGIERPALVPSSEHNYNVLVMHGQVAGMLPAHMSTPERAVQEIRPDDLNAGQWNYIALGHYHVYSKVAERAYYSGALEYTSSNPWNELRVEEQNGVGGKGFIEHDLETNVHRFHKVVTARDLIDMEPIDAAGLTAVEIDALIKARVDTVRGGIDDRIIRLQIRNIPRHTVRELDHNAIREYRRRAVSFHIDARKPDPIPRRSGEGAPGRRQTLPEIVASHLGDHVLTPGLERERFVQLGMGYLGRAEEKVTSAMPVAEE